MQLHQIEGENTKFVRLVTILNSPLLKFAEHSFVEVNFVQHGTTYFLWFNKFWVVLLSVT